MFGIDNLIGDFIGSFIPNGKPARGLSRGGSRGRGKKYYNVGNLQNRANNPVKSNGGFKASPKDKYIQDAKDAMKYGGRNYRL